MQGKGMLSGFSGDMGKLRGWMLSLVNKFSD